MAKPIELLPDLRIRDCDSLQYVIERRGVNKAGKDVWKPLDYVRSLKSLAKISRRRVGDHYAGLARNRAENIFKEKGLEDLIMALPAKLPGEKGGSN